MLIGAAWIIGARAHDTARMANLAIGAVYGLVTILGLFGALEILNIEDLGSPDNFLHLVTSALALYYGSIGAEGAR